MVTKKEVYNKIWYASKRGNVSVVSVWLKVLTEFKQETGIDLISTENKTPRLQVIERAKKLEVFNQICDRAIKFYECQYKQTH